MHCQKIKIKRQLAIQLGTISLTIFRIQVLERSLGEFEQNEGPIIVRNDLLDGKGCHGRDSIGNVLIHIIIYHEIYV